MRRLLACVCVCEWIVYVVKCGSGIVCLTHGDDAVSDVAEVQVEAVVAVALLLLAHLLAQEASTASSKHRATARPSDSTASGTLVTL